MTPDPTVKTNSTLAQTSMVFDWLEALVSSMTDDPLLRHRVQRKVTTTSILRSFRAACIEE